jgi:pimeloyl-ACP methyl ester carboxylesterase
MSSFRTIACAVVVLAILPPQLLTAQESPRPLAFILTYDRKVGTTSFTGRVYVILDSPDQEELPEEIDWFKPQPLLAVDVVDWKPGQPLIIGKNAPFCFPPFAKIPKKQYSIHAVMDFDRGNISFSTAEGNGHSKPQVRVIDSASIGAIPILIDQVYHEKPFKESESVKLVDIESPLLSKFHGKPIHLRAGVSLPKSFADNPDKHYPIIYEIPGYGGDHRAILGPGNAWTDVDGVEVIHVVLDPNSRWGHHMFVDSQTNGPYGKALIEELIPHIEKQYRGISESWARLLTGHSSGGWTSLWLQITYPDFFGGCWSTAPDEVDFRDLQRTDIYARDANFFVDENEKPRAMARDLGQGPIHNKTFSDLETVMGHGGQLGDYEAIFSPLGPDRKPRKLWDRSTGKIDPEVARSWERYDIRLVLERNWNKLEPKLKGKIHVYVGSKDTFYLEVAVGMLKESLDKLKSDAVVEIIPDRNHSTLVDAPMMKRIKREMAKQLSNR